MDNEKRLLLAIALSIAVLMSYQYLFAPPPAQRPVMQPQSDTAKPQPEERAMPPEQPPPPVVPAQIRSDASAQPERVIKVSTDRFVALFSAPSGRLKSFALKHYMERIGSPAIMKFMGKFLPVVSQTDAPRTHPSYKELIYLQAVEDLPLRAAIMDAAGTVSADTGWQPERDDLVLDGATAKGSLTFTCADQQGLTAQKTFQFDPGNYRIDLTFSLTNTSPEGLRAGTPFVEWTAPLPGKDTGGFFGAKDAGTYHLAYCLNNKVEKKELAKIPEQLTLEGDIVWMAIEEKYFTCALVPHDQRPAQIRIGRVNNAVVAYQMIYPHIALAPNQSQTYAVSLYLGPKDIDILKAQGAGLEKTVNFGTFDILAKPLLLCLKFFYRFLGNYGLAIILLTVIIKIVFWPLTHKSFQSMKSMQSIQPELAKLKEKCKDNKEELARQQMNLYKQYKVNPLGGCLPMLLQIPVFIALYQALMDSIELRHANFISFWINDLSAKDPTYVAPIIMGLSMLVQQKMTPSSADPAQAKMMMFMPIIFTAMFLSFPSGLVIYWLVNNVLSIVQQLYINRQSHEAGGSAWNLLKSKPKLSKKQSQ